MNTLIKVVITTLMDIFLSDRTEEEKQRSVRAAVEFMQDQLKQLDAEQEARNERVDDAIDGQG
jgi:pimeloyl-CoA synthetase